MEQTRESQRKMPVSSSRRRSRGTVSKESSGIWKVENEGIDSIRERYRIKDHRFNGRTRRSRLISDESSDESFNEEEMAEEGNGRTVTNKAKLKMYDEILGVPVPRKARSGYKRKPHDSVMAVITIQPSNASKGSHDDMAPISESEVEVAKFLFGLTRLHAKHSEAATDAFQSSSEPDFSALTKDSKRKKSRQLQSDYTEKPSMMITCNSKSDGTHNKVNAPSPVPSSSTSGHQADSSSCIKEVEVLSLKNDKISSPCNSSQSKIEAQLLASQNRVPGAVLSEEKRSPTSPINSELFILPDHHEKANLMLLKKEDGDSNSSCKTEHKQTEQLSGKELNQLRQDLPPLSSENEKSDPQKSASLVSSVKDCVKKVKFEIDLMVLPDDSEVDAADEYNPGVSYFNEGPSRAEIFCKRGVYELSDKQEISDSKPRQDSSALNDSHVKGVAKDGLEKQVKFEGKTGTCEDDNDLDKIGAKQHSEKIVKNTALPSGRVGLSNNILTARSGPSPTSIPCWPGGTQPFGLSSAGSTSLSVVPSLQGASPVEKSTLMPHAPLVMLPPKRPGHCATHFFVAQLIRFQQQLVKLNPLWHAAGSSAKPCSLSALPQPAALFLGSPVIQNPNAVTNVSVGSAANCSGSLHEAEKGKHLLHQQSHQGGVFLFPVTQIQSQSSSQKTSHLSENGNLLPASSASSASTLTSTSCSSLAVVPDPRYLTMFKGNNPFPNSPPYQSYIAQQQQPPPLLFHGCPYSSQLYSQHLQLTPNPTISIGSSYENCLQAKQFLHSLKTSSEAELAKHEDSRNSEVPHSQKRLQNFSMPLSLLLNQAKTAHSSSSSGPFELKHLRKQVMVQTNSPISTLSTSVSISSIAYSDRNISQERKSSLRIPKPETSIENTCSRKVKSMPALATTKTQQTLFSNAVPAHQNDSVQLTFPGSLNMRKPTISQQSHLGSSMGLTVAAAVSYVQGAASLPMKSADEQKPAAA